MPVDDLPVSPTFETMTAWAGAGRVVRASEVDVAAWRLPEPQKAALISCGVPLVDGLVDTVSFHTDPTLYRLALLDEDVPSIGLGVRRVGSWLASSTVTDRWDEDGQAEQEALAELAGLPARISALDPSAFGDGDHETRFWPAVLDRWLY